MSAIPVNWCRSATRSDVVVLGIDKQKQEISLGMKQTQKNPWEDVHEPVSH